jgi:alkylation response protein AidB-like acyl-CoA dehydrogenase
MQTLTAAEVGDFRASVRGTLARVWPTPHAAGERVVADVWRIAADQGWTELGGEDALAAAIAAMEELGRVACPLPLMDAYVAARVFQQDEEISAGIAAGSIRPVVGDQSLEGGDAPTHVLVLPSEAQGEAALFEIADRTITPGLAIPSWGSVRLGGEVARAQCDADSARALLRLGLVARAAAAAGVTQELAVEHAKERHAFGRPIGAFQAVSHRCASCEVDLAATRGLLQEAARLYDKGDPGWVLGAELAVAYGAPAALRVQFGAHHTLAAIGYHDEHEGPWLFRRVHADVLRLECFSLTVGEPADMLLENGASLPGFDVGEVAERFREEVVRFLDEHLPEKRPMTFVRDPEFMRAMADAGLLGIGWPAQYGGRDASVEELMVLNEELGYRSADIGPVNAVDLLGGAILRHGSDEQRERFLPLIKRGLPYYLGYSEPGVGSDLARLSTRAVRDGDDWVINGAKMWGSDAHYAEYIWLAVRTDPEAKPPHAGITVFLVPTGLPGWSVQEHRALSGKVKYSTFLDDVRVPDSARVGEVNGGWKVITDALASERASMGGISAELLRVLDELVEALRADPERAGPRGSAVRARVTALAAKLQANRTLVNISVRATSAGGGGRLEAPMAKIVGGELYEELTLAALEILGPSAALAPSNFEYGLRMSLTYVVGGGTNDIQRNLIARALGLPRS